MSEALRAALTRPKAIQYHQKIADARYEYLVQYEDEFKSLFGKELHLYCDPLTAVKPGLFWDEFCPGVREMDGVSYDDFIREKYGDRAADLIDILIDSITVGHSK